MRSCVLFTNYSHDLDQIHFSINKTNCIDSARCDTDRKVLRCCLLELLKISLQMDITIKGIEQFMFENVCWRIYQFQKVNSNLTCHVDFIVNLWNRYLSFSNLSDRTWWIDWFERPWLLGLCVRLIDWYFSMGFDGSGLFCLHVNFVFIIIFSMYFVVPLVAFPWSVGWYVRFWWRIRSLLIDLSTPH